MSQENVDLKFVWSQSFAPIFYIHLFLQELRFAQSFSSEILAILVWFFADRSRETKQLFLKESGSEFIRNDAAGRPSYMFDKNISNGNIIFSLFMI